MMVSKTNEQVLEAAIEKVLTGTCLEELSGGGSIFAVYHPPNRSQYQS